MKERQRYYFALDLQPGQKRIEEYEAYHRQVWPGIIERIKEAGIQRMEIYRAENRLFMIMEVDERFSFERKSQTDASDPLVQEWERLMGTYQKALPGAKPGEKWTLMKKIFDL